MGGGIIPLGESLVGLGRSWTARRAEEWSFGDGCERSALLAMKLEAARRRGGSLGILLASLEIELSLSAGIRTATNWRSRQLHNNQAGRRLEFSLAVVEKAAFLCYTHT